MEHERFETAVVSFEELRDSFEVLHSTVTQSPLVSFTADKRRCRDDSDESEDSDGKVEERPHKASTNIRRKLGPWKATECTPSRDQVMGDIAELSADEQ